MSKRERKRVRMGVKEVERPPFNFQRPTSKVGIRVGGKISESGVESRKLSDLQGRPGAAARHSTLAPPDAMCILPDTKTPMKKLLLALLLTTSPVFAQAPATPAAGGTETTPTTPAAKPKPLGAGDKKFLKDSLEGMFFVLDLVGKTITGAKVEVTKTESNALKADLDKVWAEMASYAANNKEPVPASLVGGDKGKSEKLGKAGDKFDKEFYKIVNKEVEKLQKTFESYGKSGQAAELKTIATTWEPTLKGHVAKLDAAEKDVSKTK